MRLVILTASLSILMVNFVHFSLSTSTYDLGKTFEYGYETTVHLNEPNSEHVNVKKNVTYRLTADVQVTSVWEKPTEQLNLLLLKVRNPKLHVVPKGSTTGELTSHTSNVENYRDENVVLFQSQSKLVSLYGDGEEDDFFRFKTGIASLFLLHTLQSEQSALDSSGLCKTSYETSGNSVHKYKSDCVSSVPDVDRDSRLHSNKILGAGVVSSYKSTYELNKNQVISSVETIETQQMTVNVFQKVGSVVQAKQSLRLNGESDGSKLLASGKSEDEIIKSLSNVLKKQLHRRKFVWKASGNSKDTSGGCKTLPDYVLKKRNALKEDNIAKLTAATTFLDLVQRFRLCDETVLTNILMSSKNKLVLPQLLDVTAAAQTPAAIKAILKVLNFDSDSIDLPERFLYAISTVPYPDDITIRKIVELIKQGSKNEKLFETLLLTAGSLTKTYYSHHKLNDEVKSVLSLLETKLTECEAEPCKIKYLRALRNAALPASVSFLLKQISLGGKVTFETLRAIKALPAEAMTENVKTVLLQVYHQLLRKHDSTARILAAEILLDHFRSVPVLETLLFNLDNSSVEVNTYVMHKIKENSLNDLEFRNIVREVFRKPHFGNYHVLAHGGSSTAFTNLLAGNRDVNATYGLHLEMIGDGIMKRSDFDVGMAFKDSSMNFFTFGLFAGGLGSFAGDDAAADDGEEMTAGMELNVLGVSLRPYTLFTGQGELMGHVWSGTGSETTPIFRGNFLLHDHRQTVFLQNGFVLQLSVLGCLSLDITGSIQSSLWNRNAHTVIDNKAAIVIQTAARIESTFVNSHVGVNAGAEATLNFVTDLEFAESPFKMCTQMQQPSFSIRRVVSKVENIPGSKHRLRRTRRLLETIPGKSFALHKKNSDLCSFMLRSQ